MRFKTTLFILTAILLGCGKSNNVNLTLNGTLTNCLARHACTYDYYAHANFQGSYPQVTAGSNLVFAYKSVDSSLCDLSTWLFFKTSLNNNSFIMSASQIASGDVTYSLSCACCDFAYTPKPIGGEIKGKKTDSNHWLINATVILADPNNKPIDTLVVNQYFALKTL